MAYAARCEKFHRNLMEVYDNYMVTHNPVLVPMLEPFTSTSFASAAQFEPMPSTSSSPTPSTSSGIQPLFNYVTSLRPTLEETAPIPSTSSGIPHFNDLVTILAPFFEENAPQPEPVASDSSVVQHISDFVTDFEPQLQATPSTSSGAQQNDLVTLLTSLYGGVVQSEPVSSTSSDHSSTPRTYEEAVKLIGLEDEEIPQAEQMEVEDVRAMPPPSPRPMWQPWIAEFEEVHAENVQQNVIPIAQGSNYLRHNIQHQVLPCSTRRSMMKPRRYTFKKDMPKSPPKIRVIKPKAVRQNQNNVNGNAVPAPMNIANNSPNSPLDLSSRAASMYRVSLFTFLLFKLKLIVCIFLQPSRSNMPLVNPRVGILNPIYQNAVVNPLAFRNNVASSSSNGQSQNSTPANNTVSGFEICNIIM